MKTKSIEKNGYTQIYDDLINNFSVNSRNIIETDRMTAHQYLASSEEDWIAMSKNDSGLFIKLVNNTCD